MEGDIEEDKVPSIGEAKLAPSKDIRVVYKQRCEFEEIVPHTTEPTLHIVQSQLPDLVFVVFVSQQSVSEVIAVGLDDLNLFSEIVIEVCVGVPVHTSVLAVKPVRGPNVVNMPSGDVITFE